MPTRTSHPPRTLRTTLKLVMANNMFRRTLYSLLMYFSRVLVSKNKKEKKSEEEKACKVGRVQRAFGRFVET